MTTFHTLYVDASVYESNPRGFSPRLYQFVIPKDVSQAVVVAPPHWALLDHLIAVVWHMYSPIDKEQSPGIQHLQWALEFLKSVIPKGKRFSNIEAVMDALNNILIHKYAKLKPAIENKEKEKKEEKEKAQGKSQKSNLKECQMKKEFEMKKDCDCTPQEVEKKEKPVAPSQEVEKKEKTVVTSQEVEKKEKTVTTSQEVEKKEKVIVVTEERKRSEQVTVISQGKKERTVSKETNNEEAEEEDNYKKVRKERSNTRESEPHVEMFDSDAADKSSEQNMQSNDEVLQHMPSEETLPDGTVNSSSPGQQEETKEKSKEQVIPFTMQDIISRQPPKWAFPLQDNQQSLQRIGCKTIKHEDGCNIKPCEDHRDDYSSCVKHSPRNEQTPKKDDACSQKLKDCEKKMRTMGKDELMKSLVRLKQHQNEKLQKEQHVLNFISELIERINEEEKKTNDCICDN